MIRKKSTGVLVAAISFALLLMVAGCGSSTQTNKQSPSSQQTGAASPGSLKAPPQTKTPPITLGFCPTAMNSQYELVIDGVKQEIDQLGGSKVINLVIQAPSNQSGIDQQANILEDWISKGIDAIAVCTANDQTIQPILKKATEKGIPIFEFNLPHAASQDPYFVSNVGYSQYAAGHAIGDWLVSHYANKQAKIAILEGLPGIHNTRRLAGFMDAINGHSNLQVVAKQPADWVRSKGYTVTQNILQAHPDINVLWGMYDEMALGGIAAIKQAGLEGKIAVLGYDNTPAGYAAIKAGDMIATVDTASKQMGVDLALAVYKYVIKGENVPQFVTCPVKVYDQSNIATFDTNDYKYVPNGPTHPDQF